MIAKEPGGSNTGTFTAVSAVQPAPLCASLTKVPGWKIKPYVMEQGCTKASPTPTAYQASVIVFTRLLQGLPLRAVATWMDTALASVNVAVDVSIISVR